MSFSFAGRLKRKKDEVIAVDLGTRVTKAVALRHRGDAVSLQGYVLVPTPEAVTGGSVEALGEFFKTLRDQLKTSATDVVISLGMNQSMLRHADVPAGSPSEIRRILRLNPRAFFQQELSSYEFDCHYPPVPVSAQAQPEESRRGQKTRVLVGGTRIHVINDLQTAAQSAGLKVVRITISQVAVANALLAAAPVPLENQVVAVVEIGYSTTTFSVLDNRELAVNRVIEIGSKKITTDLAADLGLSYAAAEGAIFVMTEKVRAKLRSCLGSLVTELRASMDFFEQEHGKRPDRILISGGPARSTFLAEALQEELTLPCEAWNPALCVNLDVLDKRPEEVAKDAPQLAAAFGAGLGYYRPALMQIDMLAEQHEAEERRRTDPVRRGSFVAIALVVAMLIYSITLQMRRSMQHKNVAELDAQIETVKKNSQELTFVSKQAGNLERRLAHLNKFATQRFLSSAVLSAFGEVTTNTIQFQEIRLDRRSEITPSTKPFTNEFMVVQPGKPGFIKEFITLTLTAKDTAEPPATTDFIESLKVNPYFARSLSTSSPVRLVNRLPKSFDPSDPNKFFRLFVLELTYPERLSRDE